jgi:hypothetical protein
LLGSWPSLVASWGREAIAAYIAELGARGLTPGEALRVIRTCDTTFPPSAPELAALARHDPSRPTFAEALALIYGPGGILRARTQLRKAVWEAGERDRLNDEAARERAAEMGPLIAAFVDVQGLDRLRRLDLGDAAYGAARRKQLADEWEEFIDVHEDRTVAALPAGRRGEIGRLDPLRALDGPDRRLARFAS